MKTISLCCLVCTLYINSSFAQDSSSRQNNYPSKYGRTVWAFTPLAFSEMSKAIGISYERAIDKDGVFAVYIPVMFGFRGYNDNGSSYPNSTVYGNFYAYPGVKIYPTGSFNRTKYSIGANLTFATGDRASDNYDIYGDYKTQKFTKMGFIVNNSLNLNPLKHLYLGLNLGFGVTYVNQLDGKNKGTTGLFLFSFSIGHRS